MHLVINGKSNNIGEGMCRIVRRASREYCRFDNRYFPLPDERECLLHDTGVKTFGSSRCRHRNKYNIALFYFFFVHAVRLLKRVAHGLIPAFFEIVRIVLPYPTLSDESDCHIRVFFQFCAHASLLSRGNCIAPRAPERSISATPTAISECAFTVAPASFAIPTSGETTGTPAARASTMLTP